MDSSGIPDWRDLRVGPADRPVRQRRPNDLHAEPTIAAAEAGKHVVCEKPLGRDADESFEIWKRVEQAGVVHMCAFNYRFVPAVRLARQLIEQGELGEIRHFRGRYLQEWGATDAKPGASEGQCRLRCPGRPRRARHRPRPVPRRRDRHVSALTATFQPAARWTTRSRPSWASGRRRWDDRGDQVRARRKNAFSWEINGSKGSLAFDLERLNELQVSVGTQGFQTRLVSEADDPFWEWWWPHGHVIGWEHTFVHELRHLLDAIAGRASVGPHGATFEDGYRAAEVCDAILRSAQTGERRP